MMKNKFLIIFFILTFSLMMCSKNKDVIMMEEFQSSILDKNTIVLDVRTEQEYFGPLGHIENKIDWRRIALFIPKNSFNSSKSHTLKSNSSATPTKIEVNKISSQRV